jgi:hypothetical protein
MKTYLVIALATISCICYLLTGLTSCASKSVDNSAEQQIVSNTINAMGKISTYKLDADLTMAFTYKNTEQPYTSNFTNKWEWQSQRQFNLANSQMKMSMNCGDGVSKFIWDNYVTDGWEYFKNILPQVMPIGSDTWFKIQLGPNNRFFSNEAQIAPLDELFKTAAKITLIGSENLDGSDCYILQVAPSREGISDWIISQQQPQGRTIIPLRHGGLPPVNDYATGYQTSWIRVWVEKDNYLVKKIEISVFFSLDINSISDFKGQMNFSDYNEPVSIEIPPDGLKAPIRE